MPYIDVYMTPHVYAKVVADYDSDDNFLYWLAELVASTCNNYPGERLYPAHNCVVKDLRVDTTMSVDLYVDITAWWRTDRGPYFRLIKQDIENALAKHFPRITIQVALDPPGAPGKPPFTTSGLPI